MKRFHRMAVAVLLAASGSTALAQTATAAPSFNDVLTYFNNNFNLTINGQRINATSIAQIAAGVAANIQATTKPGGGYVVTLKNDINVRLSTSSNPLAQPIASLTLQKDSFLLDSDPAVNYGISVTNLTNNAQNYVYTFPLLFSPTFTGPSLVKSSLTGRLTDLNNNGATLGQIGSNKIQSAIVGAPIQMLGVDVGDTVSFTTPGGIQNFAFYNPGPAPGTNSLPGPDGSGLTFMNVASTFSLTARDRVSMTGFAEIVPVPEPSTYAMMLAGLVFVGVVARRRIAS